MPTKIEWCDETWNPVRGCTPVSAGCDHCWAKRFHERNLDGMAENIPFSKVVCLPARLHVPETWKRPRKIFVQSMGDLFHEDVPIDFLFGVFDSIVCAPWHTYLILTKRIKRARTFFEEYRPRIEEAGDQRWPLKNVWLGFSAEDTKSFYSRIHEHIWTNAAHKFVSLEPLIGPIGDFRLMLGPEYEGDTRPGIEWVIVGGETGPSARRLDVDWVGEVRDACVSAHVPFFFKGWGDHRPLVRGRLLDGKEWSQFPAGFPGV